MLKKIVIAAAIVVFSICLYLFILGNEIYAGEFKNDPLSWYFLAKGIFCSLSLYLSYLFIETLKKINKME
jgi:hypothetical protein